MTQSKKNVIVSVLFDNMMEIIYSEYPQYAISYGSGLVPWDDLEYIALSEVVLQSIYRLFLVRPYDAHASRYLLDELDTTVGDIEQIVADLNSTPHIPALESCPGSPVYTCLQVPEFYAIAILYLSNVYRYYYTQIKIFRQLDIRESEIILKALNSLDEYAGLVTEGYLITEE